MLYFLAAAALGRAIACPTGLYGTTASLFRGLAKLTLGLCSSTIFWLVKYSLSATKSAALILCKLMLQESDSTYGVKGGLL